MGTLLRLEDPAPRLRAALLARLGVDVGAAAAAAAVRAEIGFYRANLLRGRDAESLAELRAECAEVMRPVLPAPIASASPAVLTAALMEALEFSAYPDAAPALRALRAAGCALVVVSNWDVSLAERLEETGLLPLVDAVVTSAEVGVLKPDRRRSNAPSNSPACPPPTHGTRATASPRTCTGPGRPGSVRC